MAADPSLRYANGQIPKPADSIPDNNGAPTTGTHREYYANGDADGKANSK